MTKDEARHVIGTIEESFGASYPAGARRAMWPEIEKSSLAAGEMAGNQIILGNTRLPPPAVFIETLRKCQLEIDRKHLQEFENNGAEEKRQKTFDIDEVKPDSQLGKDAAIGLKMIFSGSSDDDMREFFHAMGARHGDRWYKVGHDIMEQRKTGRPSVIRA